MPRELILLLGGAVLLAAPGCAEPGHLTYDYGRSYREAYAAQADLSRASVAESAHELVGIEAVAIRLRVIQSSTDQESEETTLSND